MEKGLHLELPKGVIFYLTDRNEQATKRILFELYSSNPDVYIYETEEKIKLEDIFEV